MCATHVSAAQGRKGKKTNEAAVRKREAEEEAEASKRKERQQLELLMMGDNVSNLSPTHPNPPAS